MSRPLLSLRVSLVCVLTIVSAFSACSNPPATQAHAPTKTTSASVNPLVTAVNGQWRTAEDKMRDADRHPTESLQFWGLEPGMTILEIQPGAGWWSDILAPYAHATGGKYYATVPDLQNSQTSAQSRQARAAFEARFAAKPEVYGTVQFVTFGPSSSLPQNTFDFILSARSVHGWMRGGVTQKFFKEFYSALKPGGILAIEQHRADPGKHDPSALSGYVTEAFVIEQAQNAGFELTARSEINANPKDTKDHPFGVWTLAPNKRTRPYSEGPDAHDPNFDRTKYDRIGESDRMTLKFRKPVGASNASS